MDFKLELVIIPVTDVDRAKDFYASQAGFRLEAWKAARRGGRCGEIAEWCRHRGPGQPGSRFQCHIAIS